jgi:hypothetical protein
MTVLILVLAAFASGFIVRGFVVPSSIAHAQTVHRVFELRTYTAAPGKLDALKARFRDHTLKFFEKHGMTNVGYWVPQDAPLSENTLTYILAYPSREAATKSWQAFRMDPEWLKARAASEANGPLTTRTESLFLAPADFSPMQ